MYANYIKTSIKQYLVLYLPEMLKKQKNCQYFVQYVFYIFSKIPSKIKQKIIVTLFDTFFVRMASTDSHQIYCFTLLHTASHCFTLLYTRSTALHYFTLDLLIHTRSTASHSFTQLHTVSHCFTLVPLVPLLRTRSTALH